MLLRAIQLSRWGSNPINKISNFRVKWNNSSYKSSQVCKIMPVRQHATERSMEIKKKLTKKNRQECPSKEIERHYLHNKRFRWIVAIYLLVASSITYYEFHKERDDEFD
eukprot:TRINITY_DN2083_c0_g1_i1.p1 TRINITY_DN2083_c0_g1~~TRINITY_DN2083_c0_g1_i1.p1  ORF type:complete len:109 (-),score=31.41 TRINITY_DN2083_c0_g1_i1:170-496(-)